MRWFYIDTLILYGGHSCELSTILDTSWHVGKNRQNWIKRYKNELVGYLVYLSSAKQY